MSLKRKTLNSSSTNKKEVVETTPQLIRTSQSISIQTRSNRNQEVPYTSTSNESSYDNTIRYVNLKIDESNSLNTYSDFNFLQEDYLDSGENVENKIKEYYKKSFYNLDNEFPLIHSIDYNKNFLTSYFYFYNLTSLKRQMYQSISDAFVTRSLSVNKAINLFSFIDSNAKESFNTQTQDIQNLDISLNNINNFINQNNFVSIVKKELENKTSEFLGRITNTCLDRLNLNNDIFINKSEITVSQKNEESLLNYFSSDGDTLEEIKLVTGSDISDKLLPYLDIQYKHSTNSFISQIFTNLSFSLYGIYPTFLKFNLENNNTNTPRSTASNQNIQLRNNSDYLNIESDYLNIENIELLQTSNIFLNNVDQVSNIFTNSLNYQNINTEMFNVVINFNSEVENHPFSKINTNSKTFEYKETYGKREINIPDNLYVDFTIKINNNSFFELNENNFDYQGFNLNDVYTDFLSLFFDKNEILKNHTNLNDNISTKNETFRNALSYAFISLNRENKNYQNITLDFLKLLKEKKPNHFGEDQAQLIYFNDLLEIRNSINILINSEMDYDLNNNTHFDNSLVISPCNLLKTVVENEEIKESFNNIKFDSDNFFKLDEFYIENSYKEIFYNNYNDINDNFYFNNTYFLNPREITSYNEQIEISDTVKIKYIISSSNEQKVSIEKYRIQFYDIDSEEFSFAYFYIIKIYLNLINKSIIDVYDLSLDKFNITLKEFDLSPEGFDSQENNSYDSLNIDLIFIDVTNKKINEEVILAFIANPNDNYIRQTSSYFYVNNDLITLLENNIRIFSNQIINLSFLGPREFYSENLYRVIFDYFNNNNSSKREFLEFFTKLYSKNTDSQNNNFGRIDLEIIWNSISRNEQQIQDKIGDILNKDIINNDERISLLEYKDFLDDNNENSTVSNYLNDDSNINFCYTSYENNKNIKEIINLLENKDISLIENYEQDSDYNNFNITFLCNQLVKKAKLFSLENNNLDYSLFSNISNKISNIDPKLKSIPIFSSNNPQVVLSGEDEDLFSNLLFKEGDNFYSNYDFTYSLNENKKSFKNSIESIVLEKEDNLEIDEFQENLLNLISKYYSFTSLNNPSDFLRSVVNNINIDFTSRQLKSFPDRTLEFLYLCNFDASNSSNRFEGKDEVTKRFIKKAISQRINSNENISNSDLGYSFDKSSLDFNSLSLDIKEDINVLSGDENTDLNFRDYENKKSEVLNYFKDLFNTNSEYKKIKNLIFNNNNSFDKQLSFYYIKKKDFTAFEELYNNESSDYSINLHIAFDKFNSSHQDYQRFFSGEVDKQDMNFGFLYNVYTLAFPYSMFIKKNIPAIMPKTMKNSESYNTNNLVKNYILFDSNINSEKASSYINYTIKNYNDENSVLYRKKIEDNFDEICNIEDSVFNSILKEINIILDAATDIKDRNFEEIIDINNFIEQNKFILGLTSNILSLYGSLYTKEYRHSQTKFFQSVINNKDYLLDDNFEKPTLEKLIEIKISNFSTFNYNSNSTQFNFSNYNSENDYKIDNKITANCFSSFDYTLSSNYKLLCLSDLSQSLNFDILNGYYTKRQEFKENENKKLEIITEDVLGIFERLSVEESFINNFFNIFYLNSLSKEISRVFYLNKDFYYNLINSQVNNDSIEDFYKNKKSLIYNSYKEKSKYHNNISSTKSYFKNHILTFGLKNSLINNLRFNDIIEIRLEVLYYDSNSYVQSKVITKYFSPLLTNLCEFYNDEEVNIDDYIGFYDVFNNSINKRYLICHREYIANNFSKYLKEKNYTESLINCHIESNKINSMLNLFYNFDISTRDFYKDDIKEKYCDLSLVEEINKIQDYRFKNITKVSKESFNQNIRSSNTFEDLVILPDFDAVYKEKSIIYEFLSETNKIFSFNEFKKCFMHKDFYDFYHVKIDLDQEQINSIKKIKIEYNIT